MLPALALLIGLLGAGALPLTDAAAQAGRMVKVVVETRQQGSQSAQGVQGGGVIVQQGGSARARGGVAVQDTTTKTTRTSGVFVLVQDGGSASMLVAQDVPYSQVAYYYDYAAGRGYVTQGTVWQRVGTALLVQPTVLPNNQIRLRLVPSLSYFTPAGGGTLELVEAATELIVPAGRRVTVGGATTGLHSVTRRILGIREDQSSSETGIAVLATLQ